MLEKEYAMSIPQFALRFLTPKYNSLLLGLACIGLILGAFFFQFVLGLNPCELCYMQRIPHYMGIILGPLAFILYGRSKALASALHFILVLAIATSGAIAAFNVGVEQEWWTYSCLSTSSDGLSADELLAMIDQANIVDCKDIQWQLFGISIAGYNFLVSFGLVFLSIFTFFYNRKQNHPAEINL